LFLIGIKDFDKDIQNLNEGEREAQIEMYDRVLSECKDALQYIREDMRTDPHSKSGDKKDQVCRISSKVCRWLFNDFADDMQSCS